MFGENHVMFQRGEKHFPPARPLFTQNAAGGCVPICAAELTPAGEVKWIYLIHAHGGNNPRDVAAWAFNPSHVYVCMMVYSEEASLWGATNLQDTFFEALDPGNAIPDANATLIYGPHKSLVITRKAMVAVEVSY